MGKCTYPHCGDCPRNTSVDEVKIDFDFTNIEAMEKTQEEQLKGIERKMDLIQQLKKQKGG